MIYFFYIVLAAAVVLLSIKLSDYVDMLDKTTKISGAFIGGVLLAAVTSLPELFTSVSATLLLNENELVLGNILGSNLFNFAVLGLSFVIFVRNIHTAKIGKSHLLSLVALAVMYGFIALDMFLDTFPKIGWFSLSSPFVLVAYIAFLLVTPKTEEPADDEKTEVSLSVKQIIIRFAVCSVLLVFASVAITYVSDMVADALSLGKTFAGALLLGIATSLPETASTLSLCKKKNYNAATGNILGSGVFNCTILVVADLLSFSENTTDVYMMNISSKLLLILGVTVAALIAAMLGILFLKKEHPALKRTVTAIVGVACIAAYVVFTALSVLL